MLNPITRRHFLRNTAGAALALSSVQALFGAQSKSPYVQNIGLQLFTLREEIKTNVVNTMKAVAAAGYSQVELYNYPNSNDMFAAAKDNGLAVNSCHFDTSTVIGETDETFPRFQEILEKANKDKVSHLIIPYVRDEFRKDLDAYKALAETFNKAAALAKSANVQLAYHNHSFEFKPLENGKSGFDIFTESFSDDMMFELDVFWVKIAGVEPAELIEELAGRVSQLHLKDLKDGINIPNFGGASDDAFQEIGNGIIPMEPIMAAAKKAGVAHCHVEQDRSPHPVKSIEESMRNLQKA